MWQYLGKGTNCVKNWKMSYWYRSVEYFMGVFWYQVYRLVLLGSLNIRAGQSNQLEHSYFEKTAIKTSYSISGELRLPCHRKPRHVTANWQFLLCLYISFSVYCGLTLLLQMEWAPMEDSSKPNLKNEDLSGTAIPATIWCYFEAA